MKFLRTKLVTDGKRNPEEAQVKKTSKEYTGEALNTPLHTGQLVSWAAERSQGRRLTWTEPIHALA
jgi:hypothetical protein